MNSTYLAPMKLRDQLVGRAGGPAGQAWGRPRSATAPLKRRIAMLWLAHHGHRSSLPHHQRDQIPMAWIPSSAAQFNLGLLKCSLGAAPAQRSTSSARSTSANLY